MIPQILSRSAVDNYRLVGHSNGLTSAYTGLFKSLASTLTQSADDPLDYGRNSLLTDAPIVLLGAEETMKNY